MAITDLGRRRIPGWTTRRSGAGLVAEGPKAGAGREGMVILTLKSGDSRFSQRKMLAGL